MGADDRNVVLGCENFVCLYIMNASPYKGGDTQNMKRKEKVVVVGGGIAGLMASLRAAEQGALVELITEVPTRRSNDATFQDGISGVIYQSIEGDSIEQHVSDTIEAGDFLADQSQVQKMCEAAPALIRLCDRIGVPFNRTQEGRIKQFKAGGCEYSRIAYCDAATGQQILYALDEQVRRLESSGRLARFEYMSFCSLVLDEVGRCRGIVAVDVNSMGFRFYHADAVILCAGGYSGLYGRTTQPSCTGAELIQTYLQGAQVANPEFVQFHPTTIACPDKMRPVGELARALGARLWVRRNERNWDFLEEQYPGEASNLPYHIIARAISELGEDEVKLDLTHLDESLVDEYLTRLIDLCAKCAGQNPLRDPMTVVPAAHYTMGGLWVDRQHMTNIEGFFAAGECDYHYHGASAMGSNVIPSAMYSGRVAGEAAFSYASGLGRISGELPSSIFEREQDRQEAELKDFIDRSEGENPRMIGQELHSIMDEQVGLIKDNAELDSAAKKIDQLIQRFDNCCPSNRSSWANGEVIYMRNLKRQLELARVVVLAARARDESRGSHFKSSHPSRDDQKWAVVTRAGHTEQGPKFDYGEKVERYYGKSASQDQKAG